MSGLDLPSGIGMTGSPDLEARLADEPKRVYEAPDLVELGEATRLLRGIVYTKYYQDCGENGTTDYRPSC